MTKYQILDVNIHGYDGVYSVEYMTNGHSIMKCVYHRNEAGLLAQIHEDLPLIIKQIAWERRGLPYAPPRFQVTDRYFMDITMHVPKEFAMDDRTLTILPTYRPGINDITVVRT